MNDTWQAKKYRIEMYEVNEVGVRGDRVGISFYVYEGKKNPYYLEILTEALASLLRHEASK